MCVLLEVFCGVIEVWMDTGLEVFFVCIEGLRVSGVGGGKVNFVWVFCGFFV